MSTYLDIYTAQAEAARAAYGPLPSGRSAMSSDFQTLLIKGWVAMAEKQFDSDGDITGLGIFSVGPPDVSSAYTRIRLNYPSPDDTRYNDDDVWTDIGALAGVMAYYQLPNDLANAYDAVGNAVGNGVSATISAMRSVASAAGVLLIGPILLIAGIAVLAFMLLTNENFGKNLTAAKALK